MAAVNEKPFLHYVFDYLQQQGCMRVVLSLGYMHEVITEWLDTQTRPFEVTYVIEQEPLGTGGGIQLAMHAAKTDNVAVLNGDTLFNIDLNEVMTFHQQHNAATTLALKEMHAFDRYGVVRVDDARHILSFEEKKYQDTGLINGGIYIINKAAILQKQLPEKFSFEKDYLEAFVNEQTFYGLPCDAYFIDIGIPEDYQKAQTDFKTLFA